MDIIDILYENNLVNWNVLSCGWKDKRICKKHVIEHAIKEIEKGDNSPILYSIAGSDFEDDDIITGYLDEITGNRTMDYDLENQKWLLASLLKITECSDDDEKIQQLQYVYSDFGYPELMKTCSIYYVPEVEDLYIDPLKEMKKVINILKSNFIK